MIKKLLLIFILVSKFAVADEIKLINDIEHYFNNIESFISDFTQKDFDGNISQGKIYIKKPGKMKWLYFPPNNITIFLKNEKLIYFDRELDEVSYFDAKNNIIALLASAKLKLKDFFIIKQIGLIKNKIKVHIKNPKDLSQEIIMTFNSKPIYLQSIENLEDNRSINIIKIYNIKTNVPIDEKEFLLNRKFIFN